MREIVRMTAQKQPLEVGVPLYPFSRNSLWRKGEGNGSQNGSEDGSAIPLPVSPPYEEQHQGMSPSSINGVSPSSMSGAQGSRSRVQGVSPPAMSGVQGLSPSAMSIPESGWGTTESVNGY